jgi:hypothetical protein
MYYVKFLFVFQVKEFIGQYPFSKRAEVVSVGEHAFTATIIVS